MGNVASTAMVEWVGRQVLHINLIQLLSTLPLVIVGLWGFSFFGRRRSGASHPRCLPSWMPSFFYTNEQLLALKIEDFQAM